MKFLHTADWHIGKPFGSVEDAEKRLRLQQERLATVDRIGAAAREHGVQCVLVAGDVFDSRTPARSWVSELCARLGRFPCPVLLIPGNHDFAGPGSVWSEAYFERERAQLCPNVRVLLEPEPLLLDGAVILPAPAARRHEFNDPVAAARAQIAKGSQNWGERARILLAHGTVQSFISADEGQAGVLTANRIELEKFSADDLDYVALGDWHGQRQVTASAWYSGTPEPDRQDRGADYVSGKCLIVEATRRNAPIVTSVDVQGVVWRTAQGTFASDADLDVFLDRMNTELGMRVGQDVLHLTVSGALGLVAHERFERALETWRNRLLWVSVEGSVTLAPAQEDLERLMNSASNPLIARVARNLHTHLSAGGERAEQAMIALVNLHLLVSEANAREGQAL